MKTNILSKKERTIVVKLVDDCLPAKAIAQDLRKSIHTVNNQIKAVYRKMNVRCALELSKIYHNEKKNARVIQMYPPENKKVA